MFECPRCGKDRRRIAPVDPCTTCGHVLADIDAVGGDEIDSPEPREITRTGLSAMPPPPSEEDSNRMRESILRFRSEATTAREDTTHGDRSTKRNLSTIEEDIPTYEDTDPGKVAPLGKPIVEKQKKRKQQGKKSVAPPPFDPTDPDAANPFFEYEEAARAETPKVNLGEGFQTEKTLRPIQVEELPPRKSDHVIESITEADNDKTSVEVIHDISDITEIEAKTISEVVAQPEPENTGTDRAVTLPKKTGKAEITSVEREFTEVEPIKDVTQQQDAYAENILSEKPKRSSVIVDKVELNRPARHESRGPTKPPPNSGPVPKIKPRPSVNSSDPGLPLSAQLALHETKADKKPATRKMDIKAQDALDALLEEESADEVSKPPDQKPAAEVKQQWKVPHSSAQKWASKRNAGLGGQLHRKPKPLGIAAGMLLAGIGGWVLIQLLPSHAPGISAEETWTMLPNHFDAARLAAVPTSFTRTMFRGAVGNVSP